MICALVVDSPETREFPVIKSVLGRALAVYPLLAAKASARLQRLYLMTHSQDVKALSLQHEAVILDPPESAELPLPELVARGRELIERDLAREKATLKLLAVLQTCAPCVTGELIDSAVDSLEERPEADSAATVSRYERHAPESARRKGGGGLLEPAVAQPPLGTDGAWFLDWGVCVVRPAALARADGPPPNPWLGKKVLPVESWGGGPVDHAWQVPAAEHWLKSHGLSDLTPSLEMKPLPKPQAAPKGDRR